MPRFVILHHDWPFPHWDLMLEQGEALQTWRLLDEPDGADVVHAEQVADHRPAYLDYEGPVSNGRGTVARWDSGQYEMTQSEEGRLTLAISGRKIQYGVRLEQLSDSRWRWVRLNDD